MSEPKVLLVTGKWASGKTLACGLAATNLGENNSLKITSDRTGLESAAMYDYGYNPSSGETRTPVFSDVSSWGPPGQTRFTMKDGFALQIVRENIIKHIETHLESGEGILLAEIAIGPDVRLKEGYHGTLFQTTEHLIGIMENANISAGGQIHFFQLEADMETRLERQGLRNDPTARKAFSLFAGDGGELVQRKGDNKLRNRLENLGCLVTVVENGSEFSVADLAESFGVLPKNPETAFATYAQLLESNSLIRITPTKFEGHPLRSFALEGTVAKSKEFR